MNNTATISQVISGMSNVKVESLDQFLTNATVLLDVHCGRTRTKISMSKEMMGIPHDDPFYKNYGSAGTFTILKKSDESELQKIENAVRTKARALAVGFGGKLMPMEVYKNDFVPFYEAKKADFFALRDKIVGNWGSIVDEFKDSLHAFLITLPTYSVEMEKQLTASIPSATAVKNSFYMTVSLSAFPVAENLSVVDPAVSEEMKKTIQQKAVSAVYEIMGGVLNDTCKTLSKQITDFAANKEFGNRAAYSVALLKSRVEKANIFAHPLVNDVVANLTTIIKDLENSKNTMAVSARLSLVEGIAEKMEEILVYCYGFSKDVGIEIEETPAMSKDTLEALYAAFKG